MNKAYLLIGGNEGERPAYLEQARHLIEMSCGKIVRQSGLYETAAWGKTDQPAFLNQALLLETATDAGILMKQLLHIEKNMGRVRKEKYGQRSIDIDMLFFNSDVIEEDGLTVPHPQLQYRRFVLEPMQEIAADFIHPVLHKTIGFLLAECTDQLDVKKLSI